MTALANNNNTVSYLVWDETSKTRVTRTCEDYTVVESNTTAWSSGWYVVTGTLNSPTTITSRITVTGVVNLIIPDGNKLVAEAGITTTGATLNIYSQSGDKGDLTVNKADDNDAAIGGTNCQAGGTVTIHGGNIWVLGGEEGAGIGGGNGGAGGTVTINGGNVWSWNLRDTTSAGEGGGAGIGGGKGGAGSTVTINDGKVWAAGFYTNIFVDPHERKGNGAGAGIGGGYQGAGGTVTINGGTVTAAGGIDSDCVGIGKGKGGNDDGTLTVPAGVAVQGSADNSTWILLQSPFSTRY